MNNVDTKLPRQPRQPKRNPNSFIWGGLGALAPMLASLAILDYETIKYYFDQSTVWIAGYSFRIVVLFILGGVWAFMHKSEHDPVKLFQLGIVGPALITGMINANNASADTLSSGIKTDSNIGISFSIITEAYADDDKEEDDDSDNDFIKGILGQE